MSDKDSEIDGLFKRSFEGFEVTPSGSSWSNIKRKLDGESSTDKAFGEYFENYEVNPSQRVWDNVAGRLEGESYKRKALWFQRAAAALLLLLVAGGAYVLMNKPKNAKTVSGSGQPYLLKDEKNTQHENNNASASVSAVTSVVPPAKMEETASLSGFENQPRRSSAVDQHSLISTNKRKDVVSFEVKRNVENVYEENNSGSTPFSSVSADIFSKENNENKISHTLVDNNALPAADKETSSQVDGNINAIKGDTPASNDGIASVNNELPVDSSGEAANENSKPVTAGENNGKPDLNYVRPSKWIVGVTGSPDYSFRKLAEGEMALNTSASSFDSYPGNIEQLNRDENGKFTCTAGLKVGYRFSDKWQINVGLQYSTKGFITHISQTDSVAPEPPTIPAFGSTPVNYDPPVGYDLMEGDSLVNVSSVGGPNNGVYLIFIPAVFSKGTSGYTVYRYKYSLDQKLKYIEVPVTFQYTLRSWRKLLVNVSGGVSVNGLLKSRTYIHSDNSEKDIEVPSPIPYTRFYFSGIAGINTDYELFKSVHLEMGVIYRRAITSANGNAPIKVLPFSYGLNTGVYYSF